MNPEETKRVEAYLQRTLNKDLKLVARAKAKDSVEVMLGEEFIGVIYKDTEDGEVAYQFNMTVLSEDV